MSALHVFLIWGENKEEHQRFIHILSHALMWAAIIYLPKCWVTGASVGYLPFISLGDFNIAA